MIENNWVLPLFYEKDTPPHNTTELAEKYRGVGLPPGGRAQALKDKAFERKRQAIIAKQRPIGGKPPVQRFGFPKSAARPKPPKVLKPENVE